MAEIVLKVGSVSVDATSYSDGDIICAFNNRRIKAVNLEQVCRAGLGFNSDGLRPQAFLYKLFRSTYQYKFERIAIDTIRRTNLVTLAQDDLSSTPNESGEYMSVELFISRRLKHPKHMIFGTQGYEVWFGGKVFPTTANLDAVWDHIEANSAHREIEHRYWPLSTIEKKHTAVIVVDDMTDKEASNYSNPEVVGGNLIKKRAKGVNFRSLMSAKTIGDLDNKDLSVDNRLKVAPWVHKSVVEDRWL